MEAGDDQADRACGSVEIGRIWNICPIEVHNKFQALSDFEHLSDSNENEEVDMLDSAASSDDGEDSPNLSRIKRNKRNLQDLRGSRKKDGRKLKWCRRMKIRGFDQLRDVKKME